MTPEELLPEELLPPEEPKKEPKKGEPKKHYVDNEALYQAFVDWVAARKDAEERGLPEPAAPNVIHEAMVMIPTRLATKSNFGGYSFRDDMIGDAILNIFTYYRNFDPTKSKNPFSYFTQISYFAFIRRILIERKNSYIKHKTITNSGFLDAMTLQEHDMGGEFHSSALELLQQNHKPELEAYFEKNLKERKPRKRRESPFNIESMLGVDEE